MSQILDKLKELITQSEISPEDQNDLLVFLPILPEETIANLVKVFKEFPEKIKEFNSNFKSKVQAITGGNDEEWNKIIEEEKKIEEEIPYDTVDEDEKISQDNNYDEENIDE